MAVVQYASMRSQFAAPIVSAIAGGSLSTSATLYVGMQGRNRAGVNLPSPVAAVSYLAGQKIQVTIPATAREAGEDIHYWIISGGIDPDRSTHVQLAIYAGYDDQVTPRPLPATLEFSEDAHLGLSATVPDEASLPVGTELINGMLRGVTGLSKILRYDAEATDPVDNVTVFAAAIGRWIQYGAFTTYIVSTTDPGGCDQPIGTVADASLIKPPTHPGDGSVGTYVRLWWILNRTEGVGVQPLGKRLNLAWSQAGVDRSILMSNQAKWRINGFTRLSDGSLNTSDLTTTERDYVYGKYGAYVLEKGLSSGYAIDVSVALTVNTSRDIVPNGLGIRARPFFYAQSGSPNPSAALTGNVIYNTECQRLIVPGPSLSAIATAGSGTINGLDFTQGESFIFGLTANTAAQVLAINGNGLVTLAGVNPTLDSTEVVRAIASTVAGVGPVGFGRAIALSAGDSVTLTINHPINPDGRATIRPDYPDPVAGLDKGFFNPLLMRIYGVRDSDGEVREFLGFVPLAQPSQPVTITSWGSGSVLGALSANAPSYGLYQSDLQGAIATATGSDFSADTYTWYVAYEYSGNQITEIDHSSGVYTAQATVADWDATAAAWQDCHTVTQLTSVGGVVTWDMGLSCYYSLTLTEDVTDINLVNVTVAKDIRLEIINPSGYAVSGWDSAIAWLDGTVPVAPADWDVYKFVSFDGATVRGFFLRNKNTPSVSASIGPMVLVPILIDPVTASTASTGPPALATSGNLAIDPVILMEFSATTVYVPNPPPNNDFDNAISITVPFAVSSTLTDANGESGEPSHNGDTPGGIGNNSVWWKLSPATTGDYVISASLDDGYNSAIAIYTGPAVNNLSVVASDQNALSATLSAGTNYYIAVDTTAGFASTAAIAFSVSELVNLNNDNFVDAFDVVSLPYAVSVSNFSSTGEIGEPSHAGGGGGGTSSRSLWWEYTPSTSGSVTLSTLGSDFDTVIAVYTGISVSALIEIASNDDSDGTTSQIDVFLDAGTIYYIAVDGYGGETGIAMLTIMDS